jgi:signal transduction histidine kinase
LIDPTARPSGEKRLRFLQNVISHVSPVLHNVYLLRRLRLRAGAIERARVARELHDSVIQALIGVEMQIDVTRRSAGVTGGLAERLGHIQDLLREEILNVRDLMDHLRARPTDTKHLLERLTELSDRFQRETGIEARFRSDAGRAELHPDLCHELTRVVQEALTNVRRHSGASEVSINLAVDDWAWKLIIVDNGKGFGWEGSASHAELAAGRLGPRTIRERVEAIGGKLQVRSGPRGARLEIVGRLKKPWIVIPPA